MPIYDYECNHCQFRFEKKQRFDDEPLAICPKCEGLLRRVLHATPILFKGSGFYITDSRSGSTTEDSTAKKPDKKQTKGK